MAAENTCYRQSLLSGTLGTLDGADKLDLRRSLRARRNVMSCFASLVPRGSIIAREFVEVETGKGTDALDPAQEENSARTYLLKLRLCWAASGLR